MVNRQLPECTGSFTNVSHSLAVGAYDLFITVILFVIWIANYYNRKPSNASDTCTTACKPQSLNYNFSNLDFNFKHREREKTRTTYPRFHRRRGWSLCSWCGDHSGKNKQTVSKIQNKLQCRKENSCSVAPLANENIDIPSTHLVAIKIYPSHISHTPYVNINLSDVGIFLLNCCFSAQALFL